MNRPLASVVLAYAFGLLLAQIFHPPVMALFAASFLTLTLAFAFGQLRPHLLWPLLAGLLRMVISVAGGWLAYRLTGSLSLVFASLALGLLAHGLTVTTAVAMGVWFRK